MTPPTIILQIGAWVQWEDGMQTRNGEIVTRRSQADDHLLGIKCADETICNVPASKVRRTMGAR